MKIEFKKLKVENRFSEEFENWTENNEIDFGEKNFVCVYAPNGVGKSSFARALKKELNAEFEYKHNEILYTEKSKDMPLMVINDFFFRNIATRENEKLSDYILGTQIAKELELKNKIGRISEDIKEKMKVFLKDNYNIKTKDSVLCKYIKNESMKDFINAIANARNKGIGYQAKELLELTENLVINAEKECDSAKVSYVKKYLEEKDNFLKKLLELNMTEINSIKGFNKLDITNDAVEILNKHKDMKICIFEDTHVLPSDIKNKLEENKNIILSQLTEEQKVIVMAIMKEDKNPFNVKEIFNTAFEIGDISKIKELIDEVKEIILKNENDIIEEFLKTVKSNNLKELYEELEKIYESKIEITAEDELLLKNIIQNCINKEVSLKRDDNKNIIFTIEENEVIGKPRQQLPLSTGEQNFLSLYFELLSAKNSSNDIIIIDDPISSFDSIYKNKIIYAIIKVLSCKKTIVLTHNINTIKLMQHQYKNCFNLYMLNNRDVENGFVKINKRKNDNTDKPEDLDLLLEIRNVICLLKDEGFVELIKNKEQFLMSIIPFMRSYANLLMESDKFYKPLCKLMHGYENEKIDINKIYEELFGIKILYESFEVNVEDIMNSEIEEEIIDKEKYPLLNRSLYHTLNYLKLRLMVENILYNTDNSKLDMSKNIQLHQIIEIYLKNNISKKTSLLSKKTLLNEFNHFEYDMCIFMPALDISDQKLVEERDSIIEICNEIKANGV